MFKLFPRVIARASLMDCWVLRSIQLLLTSVPCEAIIFSRFSKVQRFRRCAVRGCETNHCSTPSCVVRAGSSGGSVWSRELIMSIVAAIKSVYSHFFFHTRTHARTRTHTDERTETSAQTHASADERADERASGRERARTNEKRDSFFTPCT